MQASCCTPPTPKRLAYVFPRTIVSYSCPLATLCLPICLSSSLSPSRFWSHNMLIPHLSSAIVITIVFDLLHLHPAFQAFFVLHSRSPRLGSPHFGLDGLGFPLTSLAFTVLPLHIFIPFAPLALVSRSRLILTFTPLTMLAHYGSGSCVTIALGGSPSRCCCVCRLCCCARCCVNLTQEPSRSVPSPYPCPCSYSLSSV